MKLTKYLFLFLFLFLLGCFNMPTPPVQIVGSVTSELPYMNVSCEDLALEINNLSRRESQLVVAQEQRIKTSKVQAFWMGSGTGDGMEASDLSVVRGQKNAIMKAMTKKKCG